MSLLCSWNATVCCCLLCREIYFSIPCSKAWWGGSRELSCVWELEMYAWSHKMTSRAAALECDFFSTKRGDFLMKIKQETLSHCSSCERQWRIPRYHQHDFFMAFLCVALAHIFSMSFDSLRAVDGNFLCCKICHKFWAYSQHAAQLEHKRQEGESPCA